MLRSLHDLAKYQVSACDGYIGSVSDFLFDEKTWTIRNLVVETGSFLRGPRRVLIAPAAFQSADWATRRFQLALTQDAVRTSPSVDEDPPVSRQYDGGYFQYYGWPCWGMESFPAALAGKALRPPLPEPGGGDPHLRSTQEVACYRVRSGDTELGRVVDFLVDDESWMVRYLEVGTSGRWFGEKVLVELRWAPEICWTQRRIYLHRPRPGQRAHGLGHLRLLPPLRPYRPWTGGRDSGDHARAAGPR